MSVIVDDLESIIRRYVPLGKRSPQGYEGVKCAVCNDHSARGGFKFSGGCVDWHCFNCGIHARFDPTVNKHTLSRKMREVVTAFGIPETEIQKSLFFNDKTYIKPTPEQKKLAFPTDEVLLPPGSVEILTDASPWCEVAREYLKLRALNPAIHPFYVSDDPKHAGRLIIPHYYQGFKIVYWQGRAFDKEIEPRYKNPVVEKENIFFNMDELNRQTNDPLFVTEGALDALSIGHNAVSLVGSTLSEFRERELRKVAARRKVIFVIDKNQNGHKLGLKVLMDENLKWYITVFPDNIEDANDALIKMQRLWLTIHLTSTAVKGFQGKLLLEMKCHGH
jgi:hypothetical protein